MGEAFVEWMCLVGGVGGCREEDDGAFEGALEIVGHDLANGIAIGVHFVDVFA